MAPQVPNLTDRMLNELSAMVRPRTSRALHRWSACTAVCHGRRPLDGKMMVDLRRKFLIKELQLKSFIVCGLLLSFAMLTGCVQSTYSKTVTVTKDSKGMVLGTVETETVVQPAQGHALQLDLIKGVQR